MLKREMKECNLYLAQPLSKVDVLYTVTTCAPRNAEKVRPTPCPGECSANVPRELRTVLTAI